MDEITLNNIERALSASIAAGRAIMEVYSTPFAVELKDDNSPLTLADQMAHQLIADGLKESNLPLLSEEGKSIPFSQRRKWDEYWLVDPLDGTKEFIKRNGEFTVNIALIQKNKPEFGIIYVPVTADLYFGGKEFGSFRIRSIVQPLTNYKSYLEIGTNLPDVNGEGRYRMIGSRSHMSAETQSYFEKVKEKKGEVDILSKGSSLKLCMIAEGMANEYPRFAPTMEWDIAAGHAIIEGAGGSLKHYRSGEAMKYNKEDLVNDWFVAGNS